MMNIPPRVPKGTVMMIIFLRTLEKSLSSNSKDMYNKYIIRRDMLHPCTGVIDCLPAPAESYEPSK
jgi:hypothetical protein